MEMVRGWILFLFFFFFWIKERKLNAHSNAFSVFTNCLKKNISIISFLSPVGFIIIIIIIIILIWWPHLWSILFLRMEKSEQISDTCLLYSIHDIYVYYISTTTTTSTKRNTLWASQKEHKIDRGKSIYIKIVQSLKKCQRRRLRLRRNTTTTKYQCQSKAKNFWLETNRRWIYHKRDTAQNYQGMGINAPLSIQQWNSSFIWGFFFGGK